MTTINHRGAALVAVAASAAFMLAPAASAVATAEHADATGMTFDLGPSPVGLPSNCAFGNGDANFVFLAGSAVLHDSSNKNGDWGGETVQGPAAFLEDNAVITQGHLTIWGGGGNNVQGQNEGGLTLNFSSATVTIHVNFHGTTNANGTPTANITNVQVSCS